MNQKPIIFFDGVCSLCNGFINFLFRIRAWEKFNFASLQGNHSRDLLGEQSIETMIVYNNGKIFKRSKAVFIILKEISYPWKLFSLFSILPTSFCDMLYNFIAKNRYDLFGKKDVCRLPTPKEQEYFLD